MTEEEIEQYEAIEDDTPYSIQQVLDDPEFFLDYFRGLPEDEPVGNYYDNCGCPIYRAVKNYFPDADIWVGGSEQGIYWDDSDKQKEADFLYPPLMQSFSWNLCRIPYEPIVAGQALKALEDAIKEATVASNSNNGQRMDGETYV